MADDERPACAGKGFEHHQQVVVPEGGARWSCPDCGDTGSLADFEAYGKRLLCLMPLLDKLKMEMLGQGAVIMVPTEAATGKLGTFMRLDVLRVPGLAEPMIAIPKIGPSITVTLPLDTPSARQSAAIAAGYADWPALKEDIDKHQSERGGKA